MVKKDMREIFADLLRQLASLINTLTISIVRPYVDFTVQIIRHPTDVATRIRDGAQLEFSAINYLLRSVIFIAGIWSLGYLFRREVATSPSGYLSFIIVLFFYAVSLIIIFSVLVRVTGICKKPVQFTVQVYAYVVGSIAPTAITVIELLRTFYYYFNKEVDLYDIEKVIISIISVVGIVYFVKFMKIVQHVRVSILLVAIVAYYFVINLAINPGFLGLITVLKAHGLL